MKSNIFIPKTINVGYQNRSGTYTGKLAYVIYYDEKGKLRKETSWNSWRDEEIPNDEFDNVPTSGFVLNKKVGDYSNGWDHRQAYCRVYDPRNFEFEITIENLLYILENASSIKGKGLEGEFVYGWDGKDLILMPVESPDYKQISEYNKIVHNNEDIRAKDLVIGATYLTKDNCEFIYMGKFDYYPNGYGWRGILETKETNGKCFWFAKEDVSKDGWSFEHYKTISKGKLIKCINPECTSKYANIFEVLEGNCYYSPYDKNQDKFVYFSLEEFIERTKYWNGNWKHDVEFISEYTGQKQLFRICKNEENLYILQHLEQRNRSWGYGTYSEYVEDLSIFPTKTISVKETVYRNFHTIEETTEKKKMVPVTIEEIFKVMKPMYRQTYLLNGREHQKEYETL